MEEETTWKDVRDRAGESVPCPLLPEGRQKGRASLLASRPIRFPNGGSAGASPSRTLTLCTSNLLTASHLHHRSGEHEVVQQADQDQVGQYDQSPSHVVTDDLPLFAYVLRR